MRLLSFAERLNTFFYRKEVRRLTAEDRALAEQWTLDTIRRLHPAWPEERVQRYFHDLLHLETSFSDAWSQRYGPLAAAARN